MDRQGKEALREVTKERFDKIKGAILAEYRGLTVEELSILRKSLREAKAEFKIVKNRVTKKAIENDKEGKAELSPYMKGPLGVAFIYGDLAKSAKAMLDFSKDHPNLILTSALIDNKIAKPNELQVIADLPPREVILGQLVGLLVSPHRGLLNVLNGVSRNLVQVLNAIKEKKS